LTCLVFDFRSVVMKRDHRIGLRRPPRRNETGGKGDKDQQRRHARIGQRIVCVRPIQQAANEAAERQRGHEANAHAG